MTLGGVDLTHVDLTKPFKVDFSTAPDAPLEVKRAALARGRAASEAFDPVQRHWLVRADLDMRVGRCVLYVYPIPPSTVEAK